jgi:hypothetical protein
MQPLVQVLDFATGTVSPDTILRKIAQPLAEFMPFLETIFNLWGRGDEGRLACCDAVQSLAAVSRAKKTGMSFNSYVRENGCGGTMPCVILANMSSAGICVCQC